MRIVHLGLGAFHRSHQAWYTAHAADADHWGIAAFTGRRPDAAEVLAAQGCVYTLIERGPADDRFELIGASCEAAAGDDIARFVATFASPQVAIVTLTVTEAGYRVDADRRIGCGRSRRPLGYRTSAATCSRTGTSRRRSPGLRAQCSAGCCSDCTIAGCGRRRRRHRSLRQPARERAVGPSRAHPAGAGGRPTLADWLALGTSFVSTSVDRITPRLDPDDRELVAAATGWSDETPVVAEPFADWVLAGDFPSGRPQWETAGARFVDDITPWEARKLWMLNGAHTLLASSGGCAGTRPSPKRSRTRCAGNRSTSCGRRPPGTFPRSTPPTIARHWRSGSRTRGSSTGWRRSPKNSTETAEQYVFFFFFFLFWHAFSYVLLAVKHHDVALRLRELRRHRKSGADAQRAERTRIHPAAGFVRPHDGTRERDDVAAVADVDRVFLQEFVDLVAQAHGMNRHFVRGDDLVVLALRLGLVLAQHLEERIVLAATYRRGEASHIAFTIVRRLPTSPKSKSRLLPTFL